MGLAGLTYLAQGWVVGAEGFSPTMSNAIVLAEILDVVWMIWLVVVARRMPEAGTRRAAEEAVLRPAAILSSSR